MSMMHKFCHRTRREFLWEAGAGFKFAMIMTLFASPISEATAQEIPLPRSVGDELPKGKARGSSPVIPLRLVIEEKKPVFEAKVAEDKKKYGELKDFPDEAKARWILVEAMKEMLKRKIGIRINAQTRFAEKKKTVDLIRTPSIVGDDSFELNVPQIGKAKVDLRTQNGAAMIMPDYSPDEGIAHTRVFLIVSVTLPGDYAHTWSFDPQYDFVVYADRLIEANEVHLWDSKKQKITTVPWDAKPEKGNK